VVCMYMLLESLGNRAEGQTLGVEFDANTLALDTIAPR